MNLETATPLQRAIYDMCLEVERMGASPFQTRLVVLLSDANTEIGKLRAAITGIRSTLRREAEAAELLRRAKAVGGYSIAGQWEATARTMDKAARIAETACSGFDDKVSGAQP